MQVVDSFSSKSLRLMAIAGGVIPDAHARDFSQMVRHDIESAATSLELLCLVVLTNSIREDSQDTIREVQERCSSVIDTFAKCCCVEHCLVLAQGVYQVLMRCKVPVPAQTCRDMMRVHMCRGGIRTMIITGDYHHTGIAGEVLYGMLPTVTLLQVSVQFDSLLQLHVMWAC